MDLEIGVVGICVVGGGVTGPGETGVPEEDSSGLQLNKNAERITVTICLNCGFIICLN
ncbi:hypothetical protein D3C86_2213190 [compost metagenome]